MNQWLLISGVIVLVGIGLSMMVIGISIGRWRSLVQHQPIVAAYREKVQLLEESLTQTGQAQQRAEQEVATAKQTIVRQETHLTEQAKTLATTQGQLRQAAKAQTELPIRTQELATVRAAYQTLQQQHDQLQTQLHSVQETLNERVATLAEAETQVTALREQVATLAAEQERLSAEAAAEAKQRQEQHSAALEKKEEELAQAQQAANGLRKEVQQITDAKQQREATIEALEQQIAATKREVEGLNQDATRNASALRQQLKLQEKVTEKIAVLHRQLHGDRGGDDSVESEGAGDELEHNAQGSVPDGRDVEALSVPHTAGVSKEIPPPIHQFLMARGIIIQNIPPETAADPVLNSLAQQLGSNYELVKPLYQRIKRNMQQGNEFTLKLKGEAGSTISRICSFANHLYRVAFLEEYHYRRSPQFLLRARPTQKPLAQNFFSGDWLERYVLQLVQSAVERLSKQLERKFDLAYVTNPHITFNNGQEGELDIMLHVDDQIYWIETKSGDYQQHIEKYSMMARVMNLDANHAIMVLPDIAPTDSANLAGLFHMTVFALNAFEQGMFAILREELT